MANQLRNLAIKKYKENKLNSWLIGILCGLYITALVSINIVLDGSIIVTVPLLILPFFFATYLEKNRLNFASQVTFSSYIKSSLLYFSRPFYGCFRILSSLLKALLCFIISVSVLSFITTTVYFFAYPEQYEAIRDTINTILDNEDFLAENLSNMVVFGSSQASWYFYICFVPSSLISIIYFVYRVLFESISFIIRFLLAKSNNSFVRLVIKTAFNENRKSLKKDFLSLNFPLFILLFVGSAVGVVISTLFLSDNIVIITSISITFGFFFMMFFLPFYFVNMEVIFDKYESKFQISIINATSKLLKKIQTNIDLTEEEKQEVQSSLDKLLGDNKEDEEDENK